MTMTRREPSPPDLLRTRVTVCQAHNGKRHMQTHNANGIHHVGLVHGSWHPLRSAVMPMVAAPHIHSSSSSTETQSSAYTPQTFRHALHVVQKAGRMRYIYHHTATSLCIPMHAYAVKYLLYMICIPVYISLSRSSHMITSLVRAMRCDAMDFNSTPILDTRRDRSVAIY